MAKTSNFLVPEIVKRSKNIAAVERYTKNRERDIKKVLQSKLRHIKKIKKQNDLLQDSISLLETEEKGLLQKQNDLILNLKASMEKSARIGKTGAELDKECIAIVDNFAAKLQSLEVQTTNKIFDYDADKIQMSIESLQAEISNLEKDDNAQNIWTDNCLADFVSISDEVRQHKEMLKEANRVLREKDAYLRDEMKKLRDELEELNIKAN